MFQLDCDAAHSDLPCDSELLLAQIAAETALPMSQDEATEATMSSEALPLIFEPFEDVTPERAAAAAAAVTRVSGSSQPRGLPLSEAGLDQLVTIESDGDGPSHASPVLIPDWTSPWQTSGSELLEPFGSSGPSASQRQVGTESGDHSEKGERDDDDVA